MKRPGAADSSGPVHERPELWVLALDDQAGVISSAVRYVGDQHDRVLLYARGELAGELRLAQGDGSALLERLGLVSQG
jgi:hypothetical protein